jgi:hypothetical protein
MSFTGVCLCGKHNPSFLDANKNFALEDKMPAFIVVDVEILANDSCGKGILAADYADYAN